MSLEILGMDLSKVIILDNISQNFDLQKENGFLLEISKMMIIMSL
jgi:hypothetical protein